jgi:hypothetical protein
MFTNYLSRVRRNHGLEHATLHVLSQRFPQVPMAGHSDSQGFWILGNVPQEDVVEAAHSALQRLQAGQRQLAVHPNCGTNFATAGIFAGLSAWLALAGSGNRWRDRLERLPLAMTLATLALVLSRPLGQLVQERITTSGNPGSLELVEARFAQRGSVRACRITTRDRV